MKNKSVLWATLGVTLVIGLALGACAGTGLLLVAGATGYALVRGGTARPGLGDAVGVLHLEGAVTSAATYSSSGITPERVDQLLTQAAADPTIKAVVVAINSPGGSVVASDRIYRALRAFRKPVVVWMGETAASGGYYIACGADVIVAHPDSLTGSIGVIGQFITAEELLRKVGVDVVVITSGPRKDIGSPFREMTEEEQALWREIIAQVFEDFVQVVAEARDMSPEAVRELADGRVYTGRQALEAGLVDELGTLDDAILTAAGLGGIEGEPRVIHLRTSPSLADLLMGMQSRSVLPTLEELLAWTAVPSLQLRMVP